MTIGEKIKYLRLGKGMTQAELGTLISKKKSTISMYEKDKRPVDVSTIKKLSTIFHVTPDYFLAESGVDDKAQRIISHITKHGDKLAERDLDIIINILETGIKEMEDE